MHMRIIVTVLNHLALFALLIAAPTPLRLRNFAIVKSSSDLQIEKEDHDFYLGIFTLTEFKHPTSPISLQFGKFTDLFFCVFRLKFISSMLPEPLEDWEDNMTDEKLFQILNFLHSSPSIPSKDIFTCSSSFESSRLPSSQSPIFPLLFNQTAPQNSSNSKPTFQKEVEKSIFEFIAKNYFLRFNIFTKHFRLYNRRGTSVDYYKLDKCKNYKYFDNTFNLFPYQIEYEKDENENFIPVHLQMRIYENTPIVSQWSETSVSHVQFLKNFHQNLENSVLVKNKFSINRFKYKIPGSLNSYRGMEQTIYLESQPVEEWLNEKFVTEGKVNELNALIDKVAQENLNLKFEEMEYNKEEGLKISLVNQLRDIKSLGIQGFRFKERRSADVTVITEKSGKRMLALIIILVGIIIFLVIVAVVLVQKELKIKE